MFQCMSKKKKVKKRKKAHLMNPLRGFEEMENSLYLTERQMQITRQHFNHAQIRMQTQSVSNPILNFNNSGKPLLAFIQPGAKNNKGLQIIPFRFSTHDLRDRCFLDISSGKGYQLRGSNIKQVPQLRKGCGMLFCIIIERTIRFQRKKLSTSALKGRKD